MSILLPCGSWMRNKILYHEEIEQNQGSELEPLCLKARQEVSWQSQLLGDREKRMCCTQIFLLCRQRCKFLLKCSHLSEKGPEGGQNIGVSSFMDPVFTM